MRSVAIHGGDWEMSPGERLIVNVSNVVNHSLFSSAEVSAHWVALIQLSGILAPELYRTNVHPVPVSDI